MEKVRKVVSAQISDDDKMKFESIAIKSGKGEAWWVSRLIEKLVEKDSELFHEIWFDYTQAIISDPPAGHHAEKLEITHRRSSGSGHRSPEGKSQKSQRNVSDGPK